MTTNKRRAELKAEWEEADRLRRVEEERKASLTLWQRIEELEISEDLKAVLHLLDEK